MDVLSKNDKFRRGYDTNQRSLKKVMRRLIFQRKNEQPLRLAFQGALSQEQNMQQSQFS